VNGIVGPLVGAAVPAFVGLGVGVGVVATQLAPAPVIKTHTRAANIALDLGPLKK